MNTFLVLASILTPLIMFFLQKRWDQLQFAFNLVALVSILIFGNIAAESIYQIIKEKTVFMTNIHAIFLNPYFLITGSYLGLYVIYRLLCQTFKKAT